MLTSNSHILKVLQNLKLLCLDIHGDQWKVPTFLSSLWDYGFLETINFIFTPALSSNTVNKARNKGKVSEE